TTIRCSKRHRAKDTHATYPTTTSDVRPTPQRSARRYGRARLGRSASTLDAGGSGGGRSKGRGGGGGRSKGRGGGGGRSEGRGGGGGRSKGRGGGGGRSKGRGSATTVWSWFRPDDSATSVPAPAKRKAGRLLSGVTDGPLDA